MKAKVEEICADRENSKLTAKETTDIIKDIRTKLSRDDLLQIKDLTDAALQEKVPDVKSTVGPWKITQRLKVICQFVLNKLMPSERKESAAPSSVGGGDGLQPSSPAAKQKTEYPLKQHEMIITTKEGSFCLLSRFGALLLLRSALLVCKHCSCSNVASNSSCLSFITALFFQLSCPVMSNCQTNLCRGSQR